METVVTYEKQGMLPKVDKYILLSTSPRRKDLLTFLNPEIMSVYVDERAIQDHYMKVFNDEPFLMRAAKSCCELAKAKSQTTIAKGPLYLSADTIIVSEDRVCHKPQTTAEAVATLRSYFGKSHYAVTGVCLKAKDYQEVFYTLAKIDFVDYYDALDEAITTYVSRYQPFDKAGAYSIRDIDPRFIKGITGDMNTILGLPVAELSQRLFGKIGETIK
ncbi:Maf family protein [Streptococcus dysgalactiae]|uniref:Maf family protein n=1 Tax=Streptococcus dysgalactiae TaxID=1334 RepID=UPI003FD6D44B